MIKKTLSILSIILFISMNVQATPRVLGSVVVIVNNNVILQNDVDDALYNIKASTDPKNLPDDATLKYQIIEQLIVEKLILQQANNARINISDQELNDTIKNIANDNRMTVEQLKKYLASNKISYTKYREKIRNDMIIDQIRMNEVRQRLTISEQEVNSLAKSIAKKPANNVNINISHILIAIPENPTKQQLDEATNKTKLILTRLQNGESFSKLATTYSNDDLALKGGNMGWHKLNELPSIFEERLTTAQKGDIVGPLRSGVGYHILKVEDTQAQPAKKITVKEVNAKHILIKTNKLVTDDIAKQKLLDIRQKIQDGTITFAEAAKTYSEDPGSADNGGELGWNNPDRFDSMFKNGLLKLKKDELSQPIKSAFGWHLIQLNDSRNVDATVMAQKDQAYRLIFNRKFAEELQVWIQELRGDAYIKIMGEDK